MLPAPKPTRRWFQFSLGTMLLLVTVFAVWLAWELNYIRARRAARSTFHGSSTNGRVGISTRMWNQPAPPGALTKGFSDAHIPFWRTWLGDEAITLVMIVTDDAKPEYERMTYLFPEAVVTVLDSVNDIEYATGSPPGNTVITRYKK
jgi:hypothetical protein